MLSSTGSMPFRFSVIMFVLILQMSSSDPLSSQVLPANPDSMFDPLVGEDSHYSLTYLKIPAVYISFGVPEVTYHQGREVYHIVASAKTTPLCSSLIFEAHNTYHTYVDKSTGLPLKYGKQVRQQNLEQDLSVHYNQLTGTASYFFDDEPRVERQIGPGTHDFFSMLFHIRTKAFAVDSVYHLRLDVEGEDWMAAARVLKKEPVKIDGDSRNAFKIKITFEPLSDVRDIDDRHRTDVLTRRLVSRNTELLVWIEEGPRRTVLQMEYEMRFFNVHVILKHELGDNVLDVHGSRYE